MIEIQQISSTYSAAKIRLEEAEAALRAREEKAYSLREELSEAEEELGRLLDLEQADHVARIIDGEAAAPKKPKRLTRIANLQDRIAGIQLALPIQQQKALEARGNCDRIKGEIGADVLPSILALKASAFQACAKPLSELLDALVEVAAIDGLQAHFSGPKGTILVQGGLDVTQLFSAHKILDKFKKNLPPRFASLASEDLETANQRISSRTQRYLDQIGA